MQTPAFFNDKAIVGLPTGRAPKKKFVCPPSQRGGTGMW